MTGDSGLIGGDRALKYCPLCHQADDHPKHGIFGVDDNLAPHMDCCRDAGCPTGACDVILSDAQPGPGQSMLDHVLSAHAERDIESDLAAHHDKNPHLRQFTLPGAPPATTLQGAQ